MAPQETCRLACICQTEMLKCWLRHRQLKLPQRLYLWRTCINTILTYGILATNLTVQTLQEYQTTVYQMLRILIGDHAYMTRHTHQQALQHHNLPQPLELLQHMAERLWNRLQRRHLLLAHLATVALDMDCKTSPSCENFVTVIALWSTM
jgi:hypothetical protein